jgi:hypothetical protein
MGVMISGGQTTDTPVGVAAGDAGERGDEGETGAPSHVGQHRRREVAAPEQVHPDGQLEVLEGRLDEAGVAAETCAAHRQARRAHVERCALHRRRQRGLVAHVHLLEDHRLVVAPATRQDRFPGVGR